MEHAGTVSGAFAANIRHAWRLDRNQLLSRIKVYKRGSEFGSYTVKPRFRKNLNTFAWHVGYVPQLFPYSTLIRRVYPSG